MHGINSICTIYIRSVCLYSVRFRWNTLQSTRIMRSSTYFRSFFFSYSYFKIGRHNNQSHSNNNNATTTATRTQQLCVSLTKLRCEILYGGIIIIIILRLLINKYRFVCLHFVRVLSLFGPLLHVCPFHFLALAVCMDFLHLYCERLLFSSFLPVRSEKCMHTYDSVYFSKQFCFNVLIKFLTLLLFFFLSFFFFHLFSYYLFSLCLPFTTKITNNLATKNTHLLLLCLFITQNCWMHVNMEWKLRGRERERENVYCKR